MVIKRVITTISFLMLLNSVVVAQSGVASNSDFMRTLNRNATTDSIDAALFNPAGIVGLNDGFHFHVGDQFGIFGIPLPKAENPKVSFTWFNPDLILVYKRAGYGLFFTLSSPNYYSKKARLEEVSSSLVQDYSINQRVLEMSTGGSFSMWDFLSVSFGLRVLYEGGNRDFTYYEGSGSGIVVEQYTDKSHGVGVGAQAGLMMKWSWIGLSVNYKSETALKTVHIIKSNLNDSSATPPSIGEGQPQPGLSGSFELIPAELRTGLVFDIGTHFSIQAGFDIIFQKERYYIPPAPDGTGGYISYEGRDTAYRLGVGFEHKINDNIKWGTGTRFDMDGANTGFLVGLGGAFMIKNFVEIKPSFLMPLIFEDFANKKMNLYVNLGVTFHFNQFKD